MADESQNTTEAQVDETQAPENDATQPDTAEQVEQVTENDEKTFTQADLDRIIAGRLAKYADYDDMKSKLAEVEEQAMSEKEREVAKARREATAEATAKANERIIRSEARALAAVDFDNPALAIRLADLSGVTVDDDGEVDERAIKAALKAVADEAPGLLKTRRGSLGAQGHASGSTPQQESDEEKARRILGL